MAKEIRRIQKDISLYLNRHHNHEATESALKEWTAERRDRLLSLLANLNAAVEKNDKDRYYLNYNLLSKTIRQLKNTQDTVHTMLLYEPEEKNKDQ